MADLTRHYTLVLVPEPEEGGYSVLVPALPGCVTQGETVDQCVERAHEAIALHISALEEDGLAVPQEREAPCTVGIDVAA